MPLISLTPASVCPTSSSKPSFPPSSLLLLYLSPYFPLLPDHTSVSSLWTPLFFISACSLLSPSKFHTQQCSHSFSSYFISASSFSPSHFNFLLTSSLVASVFFFLYFCHRSWLRSVGCARKVHCTIATKHRILNCLTRSKIKCLISLFWHFTFNEVGI